MSDCLIARITLGPPCSGNIRQDRRQRLDATVPKVARARQHPSCAQPCCVEWDEWFATFDARRLNFIYQEQRSDGSPGNFFRLESPDREDA